MLTSKNQQHLKLLNKTKGLKMKSIERVEDPTKLCKKSNKIQKVEDSIRMVSRISLHKVSFNEIVRKDSAHERETRRRKYYQNYIDFTCVPEGRENEKVLKILESAD